ncbi:hypothetical protein QOZ80_9AG0678250 [Eleusine coracana subsp. coracana]|nr:hypothetical protein QOZ80_9AG0678250 [Eleusine coracana subsp. coracana]
MAELAVGLTKSVVEGAVTKAQSAIEEEAKLRKSAQRDLVFITGEFQMMQSFLSVANDERVGNLVVMTWVRQIRELAFDVEDCIEFVVHLDKKSDKWRRFLHSIIPPCIPTSALPLDEAVDEIEQLKARVEDVSARNARYNLISDTGSKPVVHHQQAAPNAAVATTALNLLLDERDAAKRQQGDLTQFITHEDDDLQVISVWGSSGDLGTTSLIRKAYSDQEICTTFTRRAWVKLMHPFNPYEFIHSLMSQFYEESCKDQGHTVGLHVLKKMKGTEAELFEEFEQQVEKNRYLVVLEDLSNMVEWDAIRTFLPNMKNGSWIIVSTQQSEVARLCVGNPTQVLELRQFSPDHSVYAFFKEGTHNVPDKTEMTDKVSPIKKEISASGLLFPTLETGGSLPSSSSNNKIPSSQMQSANQWVKKNPLIGRDAEMNELRKYVAMTRYNSYHVSMSVWGIAGVGKSHLVRRLYYDRMIHGQQFEQYSWMHVSRPFNLRDFCWGLLWGFQSESPEAKETASRRMIGSKNPIQECRALLKQQRCLVVIDDLQTKEEWNLIRDNLISPSASVIIVITTEASIATHCADNEELVFNVKGLQADAASDLFNNEMHRKKKQPSAEHDQKDITQECQELILKCGGLPKVIVSVAGLLAKKTVKPMDTARSINERFIDQLEASPEFNSLRDLFAWMRTYFRTCPYYLKPCIFYMSIFPQDHSIRRRRLVRRWIAEGYSRDGEDESAEDKGEEYFSSLLDLSIIQQSPESLDTTALADTRKVACQVNGFIREYIVSRRMEENLVFELGDSSVLTTQRTGRHLTITKNWKRDQIMFKSIDFSRLRSLTVFGDWKSFFVSEDMKLLRVLDLEDASSIRDEDIEQVVKRLRRLKFLSLRKCTEIRHLPYSIGDLRQLQTLDVRHTSVTTLPASITKLQKLQYIRAGTNILAEEDQSTRCPSVSWPLFVTCRDRHLAGVKLPRGIEKLTALHTLGVINIGASGEKAMLKGLKELTQLWKLGVSGINKKNCKEFFAAISGHDHLESLFVQLDKGNTDCLDGISLDLKQIQSLKLYGSLNTLPEGIDQLSKLTKLGLEMGELKMTYIELLGKLPELSTLLLNVKSVENGILHFCVTVNNVESCSYEKIRVLKITCSSIVHVTFGGLAMKNLEVFNATCFPESSVSGLENLKKLRIQPDLVPLK